MIIPKEGWNIIGLSNRKDQVAGKTTSRKRCWKGKGGTSYIQCRYEEDCSKFNCPASGCCPSLLCQGLGWGSQWCRGTCRLQAEGGREGLLPSTPTYRSCLGSSSPRSQFYILNAQIWCNFNIRYFFQERETPTTPISCCWTRTRRSYWGWIVEKKKKK